MDSAALSIASADIDPLRETPPPAATTPKGSKIPISSPDLRRQPETSSPVKSFVRLLDGERLLLDRLKKNCNGAAPCVFFTDPQHGITGQCVLTSYRVCIDVDNPSFYYDSKFKQDFFDIPHLIISKLDRYIDKSYNIIEISTKDGRVLRVGFTHEVHNEFNMYSLIYSCAFPQSIKNRFAFNYSREYSIDGWKIYVAQEDFHRMGIHPNEAECPYSYIDNLRHNICDTYPNTVLVPKPFSLEHVIACASFRTRNRFPAMVWINKNMTATMWRSSQPKTGIRTTRSLEDEMYLKFIMETSKRKKLLNIFDARPYMNAQANRAIGGGVENKMNYENIELQFLNIANIHSVREAWLGMISAFNSSSKFLSNIDKSGWLELNSAVMSGAVCVAESLQSGVSCLVHCSDGWDRTAQLCSLSQIYLDEHYRTLLGFCQLVEKDWVTFGHQFEKRLGHASPNLMDEQRAPIFIQFLDCVYQLLKQFPTHFEFNERVLVDLAFLSFSGRFGTFLCNSYKEKTFNGIIEGTTSVWSYILERDLYYKNPYYQPGQNEAINPTTSVRRMEIWYDLFGRWQADFFYHAAHMETSKQHTEELMRNAVEGMSMYKNLITAKDQQIKELRMKLESLNVEYE